MDSNDLTDLDIIHESYFQSNGVNVTTSDFCSKLDLDPFGAFSLQSDNFGIQDCPFMSNLDLTHSNIFHAKELKFLSDNSHSHFCSNVNIDGCDDTAFLPFSQKDIDVLDAFQSEDIEMFALLTSRKHWEMHCLSFFCVDSMQRKSCHQLLLWNQGNWKQSKRKHCMHNHCGKYDKDVDAVSSNCKKLQNIKFKQNSKLISIGNRAFQQSCLQSIVLTCSQLFCQIHWKSLICWLLRSAKICMMFCLKMDWGPSWKR